MEPWGRVAMTSIKFSFFLFTNKGQFAKNCYEKDIFGVGVPRLCLLLCHGYGKMTNETVARLSGAALFKKLVPISPHLIKNCNFSHRSGLFFCALHIPGNPVPFPKFYS
jgi:hypothetical protein